MKGENTNIVENMDEDQLGKGKLSVNDFRRICLIGIGSFSRVYLVQEKESQNYFAMKVMKKSTIMKKNAYMDVAREKKILSELNNRFIVRLCYAFQDDTFLYLVMDYAVGGELHSHNQYSEEHARFYISEILVALRHIHCKGIVYRDLKLENILVGKEGHIKVCNFGSATKLKRKDERLWRVLGCQAHFSPEMLKCSILGRDLNEGYGEETDYWSLGVLLYQLIFGEKPFKVEEEDDEEKLFSSIVPHELSFPSDISCSDEVKDLLRKLLEKDPKMRIGGGSSDDVEGHPWFSSVDWEALRSGHSQVNPPFVPQIAHDGDTKYVDEELLFEEMDEDDDIFVPGESGTSGE